MAEKLQKSVEKRPLPALKESNFARDTSDYEVDDGEPARVGYILEPYIACGPASDATMIKNTVPSRGSLGNDGTSRNSYQIQPDIVDADTGEPGRTGTGSDRGTDEPGHHSFSNKSSNG